MAKSGVALSPDCVKCYEECKSATKGTLGYVVYQIDGDFVVVNSTCTRDEFSYERFFDYAKNLGAPCYATMVIDADEPDKDGVQRSKVLFVMYVDDDAHKLKDKMMYASTKATLIKALDGINVEVSANDLDDLSRRAVWEKAFG